MATQQDSAQIIYDTAISRGLSDTTAKLMVGQSAHETGNWTSNAFKKHNNGFGYMILKGSKWQTGKAGLIADNKLPVADYKSLADSTNEVVDWLKRRENEGKFKIADLNTPEKYAKALKDNKYYGATYNIYVGGMIDGMRKWTSNLVSRAKTTISENKGVSFVVVALLVFGGYLAYRKFSKK
jgi:uncharacterized FlgJ-related protein